MHADTARRLLGAYREDRKQIVAAVGDARYDQAVGAHARWLDRLSVGRVRKLVLVLEGL